MSFSGALSTAPTRPQVTAAKRNRAQPKSALPKASTQVSGLGRRVKSGQVPLARRTSKERRRWSRWWAHKGSNLGPLPCEGNALPLSYAPGISAAWPWATRDLDNRAAGRCRRVVVGGAIYGIAGAGVKPSLWVRVGKSHLGDPEAATPGPRSDACHLNSRSEIRDRSPPFQRLKAPCRQLALRRVACDCSALMRSARLGRAAARSLPPVAGLLSASSFSTEEFGPSS